MTRSFLTRFEEHADRLGSAVAVSFEGRALGYRELDEQSTRLARYLVAQGVLPDSLVAICGQRSPELMVAVLGVLKAGACYLPLDVSYPAERLAFMLEDSRAGFLIRDRSLELALPALPTLELHEGHPVLASGDASRLPLRHGSDGLVYAIYTSGSTGVPKGVGMVHRALDNLIEWQLGDSVAAAGTATLQFAPLSFDVHFQEMFSTWCSGGRLVLVREELRLDMLRLLELIATERIERLFLPFIALHSLAEIAVAHDRLPSSLREVITAGEQLQITRAIRDLFLRLPGARLFNHYGPSETHVVTSLKLDADASSWPALPPIGFALPGVDLAILNEQQGQVAPGEEGELFLGGVAVGRGYLHRPELTAERFVERAGGRFYRSGDLVKELPGGAIQFLGRIDGQVKISGYRVELGEVEVALAAHADVKEAAVAVHELRPGDKRLAAYVVMNGERSTLGLRGFLRDRLPEYMVPAYFVPLAALPRTPSGKVDKRSLPAPSRQRPELAVEYVAPVSPLEGTLTEIWHELLAVDSIGVRDGFFDLGGNSLLALRAVAEIRRRTGKELPIVQFFERPTIAEQARYLEDPAAFAQGGKRHAVRRPRGERAPIAIIGLAGRFPGAASIAEFWRNLQAGVDSISTFSDAELAGVSALERADPTYVPARGVLEGAEYFDAAFFGVSPPEAAVLDPQQRLLLELSWNALEHAGYAPGSKEAIIGVYAGVHNNTYYVNQVSRRPDAVERLGAFPTMVASEKDYVATRIANRLDLTGPALSLHTACSTSLVAVATAVQQLRAGFCDMAIAGGASLSVPQRAGHLYQEGGMLSSDGHTRAFDASGSGTVFSDGAGMVVLKPLDAALEDRDTVYAVIRGVGLNNDGAHKASFTAPSVDGQAAAIVMAQEDAEATPDSFQYVEAHGTATPLGDPIEVEALTQAFRRGSTESGFCGIGSVKSNIGHLTAAAGVAGLTKVVLALVNEELPPSLHFEQPNPKIAFDGGPFFVVRERTPWRRGERSRRAGVSSFGVGGTNAHVVVDEAPVAEPSGASIGPQLLLLSAKSPAALDRASAELAAFLRREPALSLADVAYTLALGRSAFPERRAVVVRSVAEAAVALESSTAGARGRAAPSPPQLTFLFPGQGAQYVGMGQNLYDTEALFRLTVDQCAEILRPKLGRDLREVLYPPASQAEEARGELKRTAITQSALFTVEYALARTLMSWGVEPQKLVGHSVGEFVAACLAGVFDLEAGLGLVVARGLLMQDMPTGAMLSVRDSVENVRGYLPGDLDLAAENAPNLCVVAGPKEAITRFGEELGQRGVLAKLLETSHAFHSRSMDEAVVRFAEHVRGVKLSPPQLTIISTVTGTVLTAEQAQDVGYWSTHLRNTVRFSKAADTLREDPSSVLLEVGPRKTLTTLALQPRPGVSRPAPLALASLADRAEDEAEWAALQQALGRLWLSGVKVDFRAFFRGEKRRRLGLPGYSFEKTRHWLDIGPELTVASPAPPAWSASAPSPATNEVGPMSPKNGGSSSRLERLITEVKQLFEQTSGADFANASPDANFLELGIDSLLVTQLALRLKQTFKLPITFRHLMEDAPTFASLAAYLDKRLPPEAFQPAPARAPVPAPAAAPVPAPLGGVPFAQPAFPVAAAGMRPLDPNALALTQRFIELQMAQLALLQQQFLGAAPAGVAAPAFAPAGVAAPAPAPAPAAAAPSTMPPARMSQMLLEPTDEPAPPSVASVASGAQGQAEYDPKKAFGAIARIYKQSEALSPKQQQRLAQLVERYCAKTKSSKAHTQEHRAHHADPRVVTGFKPMIKELIYPIVTTRASGCRLWDLDGNEYVDALNGFGSNFFGYSAKPIADAMHARIDAGFDIGPQTPLAGESAALVCELTHMDRAAFCNTGSEAVMGAMRIARTVTGRSLIVVFSGSYHGIFDEVIVRDTKTMRSVPAAPGILPEAVQNVLVLEYGTEQTLAIIRERAEDLAAVLVEPVQSRRPNFQPREFLHEVRQITEAAGAALIFDEVITGFRAAPGGAQEHYGIKADLATYGKIVGGGMPIGVIAGRNPWMDALDGGHWQFGDASVPTAGVTYFAGTFVRHPLAMTAVHAALSYMKAEGPALQQRLNQTTTRMADELNAFFKSVACPLEIRHFASLWKTFFLEPVPYGELLFCYLRDRGVHIWDGFPCFLTLAHGEAEIAYIVDAFKAAVREAQAGDFLPGNETEPSFDAERPPVPGARLGRDAGGNAAWFVQDPSTPGKYLQVS